MAISVDRISYPGSAQVLVRGFYRQIGSPLEEFDSDTSWRASNTPDGIVGGYPWHATSLDDTFWLFAKAATNQGPHFDWVSFDPRLLERPISGKWIAASEGAARQASFIYKLHLPENRRETWLQLGATGDYDLILNGRLVVSQPFATLSSLRTTPAPPVTLRVSGSVAPTDQTASQTIEGASLPQPFSNQPLLLAYDVSRWLHSGENSVRVRVRSPAQPAMLLVDGYTVLSDGGVRSFSTDGGWQVVLSGQTELPASVFANYGAQPWGYLEQMLGGPPISPAYDFQMALTWGLVIGIVEAALLLSWILVPRLAGAIWRYPAERLWSVDATFHLCALAVILLCWLLSFDVRFSSDWCFEPKIILGFASILLLGKLLLFLPRKERVPAVATAEPRSDSVYASITLGCNRWMWMRWG